jgi:hypothetical protein
MKSGRYGNMYMYFVKDRRATESLDYLDSANPCGTAGAAVDRFHQWLVLPARQPGPA